MEWMDGWMDWGMDGYMAGWIDRSINSINEDINI
jgi:hypothetical protein